MRKAIVRDRSVAFSMILRNEEEAASLGFEFIRWEGVEPERDSPPYLALMRVAADRGDVSSEDFEFVSEEDVIVWGLSEPVHVYRYEHCDTGGPLTLDAMGNAYRTWMVLSRPQLDICTRETLSKAIEEACRE